MSESQSRYAIVERLTKSKLEVLDEAVFLKDQIKAQEGIIINLEVELENWKESVIEQNKIEERNKNVKIEEAKRGLENTKSRIGVKEEVSKEKIKTIENALKSVEEISKLSPTINK